MRYLLTGSQMKACDQGTIQNKLVPSMVLMERAALAVVKEITKEYGPESKVLVLCGSGNNGGDGFAIARLLHLDGYAADVYFCAENREPNAEFKMSPDATLQKTIYDNYGGNYTNSREWKHYDVIVDAVFGIGLSRKLDSWYCSLFESVNKANAYVVAVDIPSGIDADNGKIQGEAIRADLTVTFAYQKIGQILYPGNDYCGKLKISDIGIYDEADLQHTAVITYDHEDLKRIPKRRHDSNKGNCGKVMIAAGGKNMAGAAVFASKSAYRCGSGLVLVAADDHNRIIIQTSIPDALFVSWQELLADETEIQKRLDWSDVIAVGPGLGKSDESARILSLVLKTENKPLVLDADALNLLAEDEKLQELLTKRKDRRIVITPHLGEMARLSHLPVSVIKEDLLRCCSEFARANRLICVLKDARTAVSNGERLYLNQSGNCGMSVGGSGDVLTGLVTGLIGQGMDIFDASCLGVYLHGLAGDHAREKIGYHAMMATDLIEFIYEVIREAEANE